MFSISLFAPLIKLSMITFINRSSHIRQAWSDTLILSYQNVHRSLDYTQTMPALFVQMVFFRKVEVAILRCRYIYIEVRHIGVRRRRKMSPLHAVVFLLLLTSLNGLPTADKCSNGRDPISGLHCKSNGEGCPADTYCQTTILRCCAIIWPHFGGNGR